MLQILVQVVVSGLLLSGVYALVSIGLTLIFGVSRVSNFAQGEFVTLGMYATYWLFVLMNIDPYLSLIFVVPSFFLLGIIIARVIIKPIVGAPPIAQVFATIGMSLVIQNVALFFWGGNFRTIKTSYSETVIRLQWLNLPLAHLVAFGVAMGVIFLLYLFLKYTYLGKAIRAVAQDRQAASLMSINVGLLDLITFGIGIACAGIAGTILIPIYPVYPTIGFPLALIAFVVVVLGGLGSMTGALVGGLVIGLIETFTGFFMGSALRQIVYFIVFILVLLLKPSGFFGQRGSEEVGFK
jgi:branched-chain amino acid transport system permease protein